MHYKIITILFFICFSLTGKGQYTPDILGGNFEQQTINMPDDYDGKVVTTLVRHISPCAKNKAILYVHGYNDYFFQQEMAEIFSDSCFNFYAVDLRKYGRSKRDHQYNFHVRNLKEYFAEIDTALHIIKGEGNQEIILMGHSTGGLISSLYCDYRKKDLPIQGLILNSPFLDMNMSWAMEKIMIPLVSFYGSMCSTGKIKQGNSTAYAESLLNSYHGEWEFDTTKKLSQSPPITTGWVRAIHRGQKKVHRGLDIPCPVLVLHSHQSISGSKWGPDYQRGDAILNVKDIEKYGKKLGKKVSDRTIKNGLHDLVLSNPIARSETYDTIFSWMKENHLWKTKN